MLAARDQANGNKPYGRMFSQLDMVLAPVRGQAGLRSNRPRSARRNRLADPFLAISRSRALGAATLLTARGMAKVAIQAEAWLARHPGVVPDAGRVAAHADLLAAGWDERFGTDDEHP
jgi:hypothetical protein